MNTGARGESWYGLTLSLNLGSLPPREGFQSTPQFPWAQPGQKSLPILGALKLDIARIFLLLQEGGGPGYLGRFLNVPLSFLGVRFLPGISANASLFGNPKPSAAESALGWYTAPRKDPGLSGPSGPQVPSAALPPGTPAATQARSPPESLSMRHPPGASPTRDDSGQ